MPAGHDKQLAAPADVTYFPASQSLHAVLPIPLYLPGVQVEHAGEATVGLYLPASQLVQDGAPADENSPVWHSVQIVEASLLYFPAVQSRQKSAEELLVMDKSLVEYFPPGHI